MKEFTQRYEKYFLEDLETLNVDKAEIYPRATEHVDEMVNIIQKLLDKKIAYKSDDNSIYFDVSKFKTYGKLSGTKISQLKEGARVKQDSYEKEEAKDFALWKAYDKEDGPVVWKTKLGDGRPGWHIECSAMSMKHLGEHFDIHGGGIDLTFPHHENEIAQSEGATGKKFANYWFHNEHLLVNGQKMSKSLGNFFTLRDLLAKGFKPKGIRYLLLSANYRVQLNFTEEAVKASENAVQRINDFMQRLKETKSENENKKISSIIKKAEKDFEKAMDDDLNISSALSVIFEFMKNVNTLIMESKVGKGNSKEIIEFMQKIDTVLGIFEEKEEKIDDQIQKLIDERELARKNKDFKRADEIRNQLKEKNIILEDTKDGVRWKKIS